MARYRQTLSAGIRRSLACKTLDVSGLVARRERESVGSREGAEPGEEVRRATRNAPLRPVLVWRGEQSFRPNTLEQVRPGDTIMIPESYGADALGYVPTGHLLDVGDRAFFMARRRVRLRLHESL